MTTKADIAKVLGVASMESRAERAWKAREARPGVDRSPNCRREFLAGWRAAYLDAKSTLLDTAGL